VAEEALAVADQIAARRPLWSRFLARVFVLYIVINMALCAIAFLPWALPRETISGLLGRWISTERGWKRIAGLLMGALADRIYFWEPNHCVEVYRCEHRAREVLYPC
jgi:hypothetical protein